MSNNPPLYTEFPLLYNKINVPEFVNRRILIVTYHNMGYPNDYIAEKLSVTPKYCSNIISIFHSLGSSALLKRDFGKRNKKMQKKLNDNEIKLIQNIVRHTPPRSQNKWTYNILTIIINNSGLFSNPISLGALRAIMISHNIALDAWKSTPLKKEDTDFNKISDLISHYNSFEAKSFKDFDLDIPAVDKIIDDLISEQKAITLINVYLRYKQMFNLPKLSIYKFTKLLKYNFKNWDHIKQQNSTNQYVNDKILMLSDSEKEFLNNIIDTQTSVSIIKKRAQICLELAKGTSINDIEDTFGYSKSMIYKVYRNFLEFGINSVPLKKRKKKMIKKNFYTVDFVKKYPNLEKEIREIISLPPKNKHHWTIVDITKELKSKNYNISTTSIAKIINNKDIQYH